MSNSNSLVTPCPSSTHRLLAYVLLRLIVHIGAMKYGLTGYERRRYDALHTTIEHATFGLLLVHLKQPRRAVQLQCGLHNALQYHGKCFHAIRLYSMGKQMNSGSTLSLSLLCIPDAIRVLGCYHCDEFGELL